MKYTIEIKKSKYIELLITEEQMRRLVVGGVDNWEYYSESLHNDELLSMDDFGEEVRQNIYINY